MITPVIVYGTLMPGQVRWLLLAPFVTGAPGRDQVEARLLGTGCGYPALVDLGAPTRVEGWVVPRDDHACAR